MVSCESVAILAAAERIHLCQSAVTRRIQALEETLQTTLLYRETRAFLPTDAGKKTYGVALKVLASLRDLQKDFLAQDRPFEFRFGISRTLGDLALTEPIRVLQIEYGPPRSLS